MFYDNVFLGLFLKLILLLLFGVIMKILMWEVVGDCKSFNF